MTAKLKYRLFAIVVISIHSVAAYQINNNDHRFRNALRSDAIGYYTWLPAIFIYDDASFEFCDSVFVKDSKFKGGGFENIIVQVDSNQRMNKYPIGSALSAMPLFFIAEVYGAFVGERKGFEKHYQHAWFFAGLIFTSLGIWFLCLLAERLKVHLLWLAMVLLSALWGTNLFQYTSFDIGYSHSFTFGWMCIAVYNTYRYVEVQKNLYANRLAIALAVLILVRPFNVLLLPLLIVAAISLFKEIKIDLRIKKLLTPALLFILIASTSFIGNYWQTGSFFIYSYGSEVFDLTTPHFIKFLFGFEIGAFLYSPLYMGLILLAIVHLIRQKKNYSAGIIATGFLGITWLLSCWSTWTFGCTLGNRPLVDFLPIFIPLALKFQIKSNTIKWVLAPIIVVGISYSQILHYQYRTWILDRCAMNQEKFSDVFLRTSPHYAFYTSGGWSFENTIADTSILESIIDTTVIFQKGQNDAGFLEMDFTLDSNYKHRMLVSFDGKFTSRRGENRLVIYGSKGKQRDFVDYQQKFIKKDLRIGSEWTPFRYEFFVPYLSDSLHYNFLIVDNQKTGLEMRNVRAELIRYLDK